MLLTQPDIEGLLFHCGILVVIITVYIDWSGFLRGKDYARSIILLLGASVLLFAASLGLRWHETGNGPFVTLYEVLTSNLFSLGLVFTVVYRSVPVARSSSLLVLPFLAIMGLWAATTDRSSFIMPATYDTMLLWVHVGVGKVFLGLCLVATGLAGVLLIQRIIAASVFDTLPGATTRDELAWRFMAVAFIFHGLMLIAGAAWAQDAWGRFWAWDSLETWAFITWLVLGLSLHARLTWKVYDWVGWLMIVGVFMLALLTFFGVPFSSVGPHRGIV